MKLYIGNLNFQTSEQALREQLETFGPLEAYNLVIDRRTGRSRGYAFATFQDRESGQAAVDGMNGHEFEGRELVVREAVPKAELEELKLRQEEERPASRGYHNYILNRSSPPPI